MKKDKLKQITRVFLYIVLLILVPSAVFAAEAQEESAALKSLPDASESSAEVPSASSESPGISGDLSNEVKITGYTIYDGEGPARVNVITKDQIVVIQVTIYDNRKQTFLCEPSAVLNTASFRPSAGAQNGDAKYIATNQNGVYTLSFICRYTGTGNTFGFDLSYPGSGAEMKHMSIILNQCVEYIEPEVTPKPEPSSEPEITVKGTGFALKSLSYGAKTVYAGNSFELQVSLLATRGDYGVEDVSVSAVLPEQLTSSDGNMIQYIGTVQPGGEMSASFQLTSNAAAEQGSYSVTVNIRGMSSADGGEITSSVEISIPIKQVERFEISKLNLPEQINVNYDDGQGYTGVYFVNKGKTPIYNIAVSVEGNNITSTDGTMFFGNLEPGKEGNVDCNLMAKEAGTLTANVRITYENADGVTSEMKREFTVKASAGMALDAANTGPIQVDITQENSVSAWIWVVIGMASVLLFSGIRYFIKNRKAEQIALLEEGTPDDNF